MFNFKIPIYAGTIGFVLILITNILKRNSLFVVFFRSFFYGVLVFGIILGIYFILNKFLNIDFNIDNTKPDEDEEEEKGNVDILVGKDDLKTDYEEEENEVINEEELKENENVKIENEKEENEINPLDDFIIKEEKLEKKSTIDNIEDNISELPEENKIFESEDGLINDNIRENKINEIDDLSLEENSFQEKETYNNKKSKGDFLKGKIGIDVSYEDLAKAIRTKIKRDE